MQPTVEEPTTTEKTKVEEPTVAEPTVEPTTTTAIDMTIDETIEHASRNAPPMRDDDAPWLDLDLDAIAGRVPDGTWVVQQPQTAERFFKFVQQRCKQQQRCRDTWRLCLVDEFARFVARAHTARFDDPLDIDRRRESFNRAFESVVVHVGDDGASGVDASATLAKAAAAGARAANVVRGLSAFCHGNGRLRPDLKPYADRAKELAQLLRDRHSAVANEEKRSFVKNVREAIAYVGDAATLACLFWFVEFGTPDVPGVVEKWLPRPASLDRRWGAADDDNDQAQRRREVREQKQWFGAIDGELWAIETRRRRLVLGDLKWEIGQESTGIKRERDVAFRTRVYDDDDARDMLSDNDTPEYIRWFGKRRPRADNPWLAVGGGPSNPNHERDARLRMMHDKFLGALRDWILERGKDVFPADFRMIASAIRRDQQAHGLVTELAFSRERRLPCLLKELCERGDVITAVPPTYAHHACTYRLVSDSDR